MVDPSAVAEILVQHALQHCRDDVAIVMVYGSRAKKTA